MRSASTVMRLQIIAHGERIYCADEATANRSKLRFTGYARLNEERREILANIHARESIMADDVLLNKVTTIALPD